jgi:hypothetical protein
MIDDVAAHEAAHVVLGLAAGRTLASVSVQGKAGLTVWAPDPEEPATRDLFDARIIGLLAGAAAERMFSRIQVARIDDTPSPDIVEKVAALPARHREVVTETYSAIAADPFHNDDEQKAQILAYELRNLAAGAYVAWLTLEAERAVVDHLPAIAALRDALLQRGFLSGPEAVSIVQKL